MRVIETLLSSFIIIAALSFVTIFAVTPSTPTFRVSDLKQMGYSVLHDLDQQGLLAPFVYNQSWTELRTVLKITLPIEVYFNLNVYDLNGARSNDDQIIYGDVGTFDASNNIVSVAYTLIGYTRQIGIGNYDATYDPRIIVLQLSRG
jgi:hypothetical protein